MFLSISVFGTELIMFACTKGTFNSVKLNTLQSFLWQQRSRTGDARYGGIAGGGGGAARGGLFAV